ncbi:hypothetical protein [Streptomyces buecherae]|uniref:hypothetical protein n=1 Tax=Streptomyces buecherae TaxID=2763006 RepID=UPI0037A0C0DB
MAKNRKRPGRVRTKRDNRRAPLLISQITPQNVNLRTQERPSILCLDCGTWRRLMGGVTQLKIREHLGADGEQCPGSNQAIKLDIDIATWGRRVAEADATVAARRPTAVRRKPKVTAAPAVSQIIARPSAVPKTVDTARRALAAHQRACRTCPRARCAVGRELEVWLAETTATARLISEEQERRAGRPQPAPVRRAQWAKRGGPAVEAANNTCAPRRAGARSEYRGPELPLVPLDVAAHERRQAELGAQYAQRRSSTSAV